MSVFRVGSNKSSVNNFPSVRPTLDLDFANSKTLDPRITFTRASGGSYTGADGLIKYAGVNEARFDHDPVTGESLGLLVEEARTNLLLRSEEFNTASWIKIFATASANVISAPDGTTTADKLEETSGTGEHIAYQGRAGSNETVTLSIFCKQAERTRVRIGFSNFVTEGKGAIYDLNSGSVVLTEASGTDYTNLNASISSFGNGWYRCVFTATKGAVNTTNNPFVETVTGTLANFAGTTGSGIYVWGAQLEAGSFPTSYIPTTTATRTRSADVASISGSNFSSWFNGLQGTMFASGFVEGRGAGSFSRLFAFVGANAGTDEICMYTRVNIDPPTNGKVFGASTVSSVLTGDVGPPAGASAGNYVSAFAYRENDFALASNGFGPNTDTSGSLPTCERFLIYGQARFQNMPHGTIKRFCYWPRRLSNQQLQALTR